MSPLFRWRDVAPWVVFRAAVLAPSEGIDIDPLLVASCEIHSMDLVREAKDLTHSFIRKAEAHFGRSFTLSAITFDLVGGTAGRLVVYFNSNTYLIRYNRLMLEEHPAHVLKKTVPHEVAHLVAFQLHGPKIAPHGKEWRSVMSDVFGVVPEPKHNLDTSRVTNNRFVYGCSCPDDIHVSKRTHNKIVRGTPYKCVICQTRIYFVRVADAEKAFPKASRLLVSSIGSPLTERHMVKAKVLLDKARVSSAVVHGDGADASAARLLAKALDLEEAMVEVHPSPNTIPDKISHALFFLEQPTQNQIAAIDALRAKNTVVRVVKHPSKAVEKRMKGGRSAT